MHLSVIMNAFVLALGLILPLGVQNLFVFNQGASQRRYSKALPVVITASLCDTLLILFAVGGVSAVALSLPVVKTTLIGLGTLFLLYMGWTTWRSKPKMAEASTGLVTPRRQIAFAMSVSLLNPHAILDTVGVIGTSSLQYGGTDRTIFAITCMIVSWLWFAALAYAGRVVGSIDRSGKFLLLLNRVSAIFMWGTAIYLGSSLW